MEDGWPAHTRNLEFPFHRSRPTTSSSRRCSTARSAAASESAAAETAGDSTAGWRAARAGRARFGLLQQNLQVLQQVEILKTPTVVTQHGPHANCCPHCRKDCYALISETGVEAGLFDPRLTALVTTVNSVCLAYVVSYYHSGLSSYPARPLSYHATPSSYRVAPSSYDVTRSSYHVTPSSNYAASPSFQRVYHATRLDDPHISLRSGRDERLGRLLGQASQQSKRVVGLDLCHGVRAVARGSHGE